MTCHYMTNRIFVDTSAWLAYFIKGEQWHQETYDYFQHHIHRGCHFFSSDYVLDECYTRLITQQSFHHAQKFKQLVDSAARMATLLILFTDTTIFKKAWINFKKYQEHRLSFTDATITVYMQDFKLTEIMTLDQGFAKAGFTTSPKTT